MLLTRRDLIRTTVLGGIAAAAGTVLTPSQEAHSMHRNRRQWLSGASGDGVVNGSFGAWRGRKVDIAGTWNDNWESQERQWSVLPGFTYGDWQGHLDNAVGGIYKDRGESWAAAANRAYDNRWRNTLTNLKQAWTGRPGTMYIRFAHEFNGTWYPWSVTSSETEAFKAAWVRFRTLQREIFPAAKLVFCPNGDTTASGLDWRNAFPGAAHVDVLAVDSYNQYPFVDTEAEFAAAANAYDESGSPRGIERHRQFAAQVGLPFAVPEWSSNADMGDAPVFVAEFHKWLAANAGSGPGRVLYEIHFNVGSHGSGEFQFYPTTRQPQAASTYQRMW